MSILNTVDIEKKKAASVYSRGGFLRGRPYILKAWAELPLSLLVGFVTAKGSRAPAQAGKKGNH